MNTIVRIISSFRDSAGRTFAKFYRLKRVESAAQAMPFGVDSNPPEGMSAIYGATMTKGQPVIIGYILKSQLSEVGENRLFSIKEDGTLSTFIWLKNDGTMQVGGGAKHMVRFEELKQGFDQVVADLNQARIALSMPVSTASIDTAKINEIKTL